MDLFFTFDFGNYDNIIELFSMPIRSKGLIKLICNACFD